MSKANSVVFAIVWHSWIHFTESEIMNRMIFTTDWLFMTLVGPGGSGKARLIHAMLVFPTSYWQNLVFLQRVSTFLQNNGGKLDIEFVSCWDFEMIRKLENCLLVSDDSCQEIYQQKEFVKIAVAGRLEKTHCSFVKLNLIHQNKWMRTIDLNTTHGVLFKSTRSVQQTDHFGRHLNNK